MTRFGRISADDKLDRYYTPEWATRALLDKVNIDGKTVLEPCAGQGHIAEVVERDAFHVICGDIDPDSPFYNRTDATSQEQLVGQYGDGIDAVITNPPYSADSGSASGVIRACLDAFDVPVICLLRLSFLEPASGRFGIIDTLDRALVLPRVNFHGPGPGERMRNNQTSVWCAWNIDDHSSMESATLMDVVSKYEADVYRGQSDLF